MPADYERELGGIHARLDNIERLLTTDVSTLHLRVRALEDFKSRVYGAGAALAVTWTVLTFVIAKYV